VVGTRQNMLGTAASATQGTVIATQIETRPLTRTGELLEFVPGVIVTQHSGDGKANQYFARGFNLDHGTDFRTTVIGMPVNMPSHAHGQGYSDLNFLIPELVRTIQYKKGTYYAEEGDFSTVGTAAIDYVRTLNRGLFNLEFGQNAYRRVIAADSTKANAGNLLYALEAAGNDGPWNVPEHYRRLNGVLSYSLKSDSGQFRITGMTHRSSWNATDQVPQRALDAGLSRFGTIDPTDGGKTARISLSADWSRSDEVGVWKANAYLLKSRLDLFSNFTYAMDDPVNGDQFQQSERRTVSGLNSERSSQHRIGNLQAETAIGAQIRRDQLSPVGLYATSGRSRLSTTREDTVDEQSAALYVVNTIWWRPWLRTVAGLRSDYYRFDVASKLAANSGKVRSSMTSPKLSAIFAPTLRSEFYLNWGRGFHSNDARGIVGKVDPKTGTAFDPDGNPVVSSTPLAKAIGREAGLRINDLVPGLQTSVSLWRLDLASELVFVGDAGTTEAGRPSRRNGVEIANYYVPAKGWIIDANLAWSRARFTDGDAAGSHIPGAIGRIVSVGASGEFGKWSGGLRFRHFGKRVLVEDASVRSPASTLVNATIAYALTRDVKLSVEAINLFNRKTSDIDYYYESQLSGEQAPVSDIHTHPAEPRSLRVGLRMSF
jgi:outer membrane receptor protein involved in Fe transport